MNADEERRLLEELREALDPDLAAEPPPERIAAVRALAEAQGFEPEPAPVEAEPEPAVAEAGDWPDEQEARVQTRGGRRDILVGGAAATAGAALGILTGRGLLDSDDEPSASAPVTEAIRFTGAPPEITTNARLINHTWGTELLLDIEGTPDGVDYQVVYLAENGDLASGGSFKGVAGILMRCRFNSSLLRDEVGAIEIRDPDDEPLMRSDLT